MTTDEKTQLLYSTRITNAMANKLLYHVIHCNWQATDTLLSQDIVNDITNTCIHRHYDLIWKIDSNSREVILLPQNNIIFDLYMSPVDCKPATCKRSGRTHVYVTEKDRDAVDILIPSDDGEYWKHVCAEGSECRIKKHPLQQAHPLQQLKQLLDSAWAS